MMTNEKLAELPKAGQEYITQAKAIVEEHGEDLSAWPDSVRTRYDDFVAKAGEKLVEIRTAKDDLAVIEKAHEIGAAIGGGIDGSGTPASKGQRPDVRRHGGRAGGPDPARRSEGTEPVR